MTSATDWSIGISRLGSEMRPIVASTAVSASRSGTPAAMIEPKTSTRIASVSGTERMPTCLSCLSNIAFSALPELALPASPM